MINPMDAMIWTAYAPAVMLVIILFADLFLMAAGNLSSLMESRRNKMKIPSLLESR